MLDKGLFPFYLDTPMRYVKKAFILKKELIEEKSLLCAPTRCNSNEKSEEKEGAHGG